jgi:hypothetical protein
MQRNSKLDREHEPRFWLGVASKEHVLTDPEKPVTELSPRRSHFIVARNG